MTKRIRNNDLITRRFGARTLLLGGLSALALTISGAFSSVLAEEQDFDIDAGPAVTALKQFAQQANVSVVYSYDVVQRFKTNEVDGVYEPDEALRLMLAGTGLFLFEGEGGAFAVRIRKEGSISTIKPTRVADNGNDAPNTGSDNDDDDDSEQLTTETDAGDTEEVFVTGSHIRGEGPVGSKVFTYDREEIYLQGYSTIPQFIQGLPQNFNGGISENTAGLSVDNGAAQNISGGTGINLRGLGNVSTLVLLNGQRLSPSGIFGNYVDVSMIPLSAVERVEILADGASAIYGSDAIGGVVNFKMRKDYDGAETRVRYGGATQGGLEEITVGQTFGKAWDGGYGLITYEYNRRDPLEAKDRSFSKGATALAQLVGEQTRHSVFLTGGQNLTEDLEVFTTAYFNQRNLNQISTGTLGFINQLRRSKTKQYGAIFGSTLDLDNSLGNGWYAELVGAYSRTEVSQRLLEVGAEDSNTVNRSQVSENLSVDAKLDGSLFSTAGGDVKLAFGGRFQHNTYGNLDLSSLPGRVVSIADDSSRNVTALFGEIYIPVVGTDNKMAGIERLEFSIAVRYEYYNDFGSSTDPKFGILWSPVKGLNFRGTWGTSFRAPLLREKDDGDNSAFLVNIPNDTSATGTSLLIMLSGSGNAALQPETATIWTAGFDYQPDSLPGFKVSTTYFNIDYKNRIAAPAFPGFAQILNDPRQASLITSGLDADFFASIENRSMFNFTSFPGFGPPADFADAEFSATYDVQNLSRSKVTGLDFSVIYGLETDASGSWNFSVSGTYLFNFKEQLIVADPFIEFVGTISKPVNLRLKAGLSWAYEGFTTSLTVNYVDSYLNTRTDPETSVSSWTTVNLYIAYDLGSARNPGFFKDTVLSLSVQNLFDQDPPFIAAPRFESQGVFYDPNAANPHGRVIAFQITKQW